MELPSLTVGNPGTNTITISPVPGGIGETITGNTGGVVSPDSSGIWNIVGDGTTVNIVGNPGTNTLTVTSASGSGILQLIQSQTITNASSVSFTNVTGYNGYALRYFGVVPSTDMVYLRMQLSTNGGSTYQASLYESSGSNLSGSFFGAWTVNPNAYLIITSNSNTQNQWTNNLALPGSGEILFSNFGSTSFVKTVQASGNNFTNVSSFNQYYVMSGYWNNSAAVVNAVQLTFSLGNIAIGTFALYGVL